jgi:hypothetical protein
VPIEEEEEEEEEEVPCEIVFDALGNYIFQTDMKTSSDSAFVES